MNTVLTELTVLPNLYATWVRTQEKTKAIDFSIEGIAGKIIFARGYEVYGKYDITPATVWNVIYVTSSNNGRISTLFHQVIKKDPCAYGEIYNFKVDLMREFKISFLPNLESIYNKIASDDAEYAPRENPDRPCILV